MDYSIIFDTKSPHFLGLVILSEYNSGPFSLLDNDFASAGSLPVLVDTNNIPTAPSGFYLSALWSFISLEFGGVCAKGSFLNRTDEAVVSFLNSPSLIPSFFDHSSPPKFVNVGF